MDVKVSFYGLCAFVRDRRPGKAAATVLLAAGAHLADVPAHRPLLLIEAEALEPGYTAHAIVQIANKTYALWLLDGIDTEIEAAGQPPDLDFETHGDEAWSNVVHLDKAGPKECGKADSTFVDTKPDEKTVGARVRFSRGRLRAFVDPLHDQSLEFPNKHSQKLANGAILTLYGASAVTFRLRPWDYTKDEIRIVMKRSGEAFITNLPITPTDLSKGLHHFASYWKLSAGEYDDGGRKECRSLADIPKGPSILAIYPVACPPVQLELP